MEWSTIRRETGLIEHVCEHGVGHPSRASALWRAEGKTAHDDADGGNLSPGLKAESVKVYEQEEMIHGCDGCCNRADFPGSYRAGLMHAHGIMRTTNRLVREQDGHLRLLFDILRLEEEEKSSWWRWPFFWGG